MESEADLINSLIRVIRLQGRAALESVFTSQVTLIQAGSGKLVSTNVGGKAFSFAVDNKMTVSGLMVLCDKALRLWDSMDATARARFLASRPIRTARAVF